MVKAIETTKGNVVVKEVEKNINLQKLMVEKLGYSKGVWKSQKSRIVKAFSGMDGADVFTISEKDLLPFLKVIAGGKGKFSSIALDLMKECNKKEFVESLQTPYIEEKKEGEKEKKSQSLKSELIKSLLKIEELTKIKDVKTLDLICQIIEGLTL